MNVSLAVIAGPVENVGTNASIDEQLVAALASYRPYGGTAILKLRNLESDHRKKFIQSLLKTLNDPQLDNQDFAKNVAAYYLGELSASEAVDSLAAHITINSPPIDPRDFFPGAFPAAFALINIGAQSIPAVMRNITESDDEQVRHLSVFVINWIEGQNKDVTQFRLQKALDAQSDPAKKARVQAVLESLSNYLKLP